METHQKCRKKIYFVYEGTMEFSCSFHLRARREKKLYIKIFYFQSIFTPFLIATNLSWIEKDFTHDKISSNNKEICNYLKQN